MTRRKRISTLWQVPDNLWARLAPLINQFDPPRATGRKREDPRKILDALIFRFRTGCQWNQLPAYLGDDATVHRTFQRWVRLGLCERIWSLLVAECDDLGLVEWDWQAVDGTLGKARGGGDLIGPNPTDRAKNGTKKSLLVDGQGGPLSVVVAPANVNDHLLLEGTIAAVVVERPAPTRRKPQHLCLDAGYDNAPSREVLSEHGYQGHIRSGGEAPPAPGAKKYPARRWVVERTIAWLSKCRGLLIRYEKKAANFLALLMLACALLWYRRLAAADCRGL